MSFENFFVMISFVIFVFEGEIKQSNKDEIEKIVSDVSLLVWFVVGWGVLGVEDKIVCNIIDIIEFNKSGIVECMFLLFVNVVGLEGYDSGDVGVGIGCDEEDVKVVGFRSFSLVYDGQIDQVENLVEDDDGFMDVVFVIELVSEDYDDISKGIWGCNKVLSFINVEVYVLYENDREGVS